VCEVPLEPNAMSSHHVEPRPTIAQEASSSIMRFLFFILAISIPTLISAEKISFELRKKHFSVIPEGFCEPEKGSQAEKNFTKHSDLMERAGLERPILMLVDCEYNTGDRSQFFSTFYMYPENNSVSRFSRELINSIFKQRLEQFPTLTVDEFIKLVDNDIGLGRTFSTSESGQFVIDDKSEIFISALVKLGPPFSLTLMGVEVENGELFNTVMEFVLDDFMISPEENFRDFRTVTRSITKVFKY